MNETEKAVVQEWYRGRGPDQWPTFTCSYSYKGKQWAFDLVAEDFDDAQQRLAALGTWGKVEGILYGTVPANTATSLWVKTLVGWRNFWGALKRKDPE